MKRYIGDFRESLSLLSTSALRKWFAIVVGTCVIFAIMMGRGGGPVDKLFTVAGYIGNLFAYGIPFIVGASFLFSSQETQNNIVDSIREGRNNRFARFFILYVILTLSMMALAVLIGFVFILPSLTIVQVMSYLAVLLVSTLFISLLVCPIAALLALTIDDLKTSMVLGVVLFFAIAFATGNPNPVNYPEIALLGPAHIFTAVLFVLIGGFSEYQYAVVEYVGVGFTSIQLIISLSLFTVITVISISGARRMFHSNLSRWTIERELWLSTSEGKMDRWLDTDEIVQDKVQAPSELDLTAAHTALKQRRRFVAVILIAAILMIPMGGISYVSVRQSEWRTVVYETSSVTIELGVDWLYGEFTGVDPAGNIDLALGCEGVIVGGKRGSAHFNFDYRQMTLDDFLQLNDTELEDMFGRAESGNFGQSDTFSSGWGGPIHAEQYIWVLRFNEVGGETEGIITISFQVIIRAV